MYLDRDFAAFAALTVNEDFAVSISNFLLLRMETQCAAFEAVIDNREAFDGGGTNVTRVVLEQVDGVWGYSWIGKGWQCDGPHPLP